MIWTLIEPYVNEKGWSIPELARQSGVQENHLYNLKNGWNKDMGATKLVRVCVALEMDLNVLKQLIVDEDLR